MASVPYTPIPYPAWRYHIDGKRTMVVQDPTQDAQLDPAEWKPSIQAEPIAPPPPAPDHGATDHAPVVASSDEAGPDESTSGTTPKRKKNAGKTP